MSANPEMEGTDSDDELVELKFSDDEPEFVEDDNDEREEETEEEKKLSDDCDASLKKTKLGLKLLLSVLHTNAALSSHGCGASLWSPWKFSSRPGGQFVSEDPDDTITRLVEDDPALRNVRLQVRVTLAQIKRITEHLELNKSVSTLILYGVGLNDEMLSLVTNVFRHNKKIDFLNISCNRFSADGLSKALENLCTNTKLREICMSRCVDSKDRLKAVCDFLASKSCHLKSVTLSDNDITDEQLSMLVNAAAKSTTLEKICLIENPFNGDFLVKLLKDDPENEVTATTKGYKPGLDTITVKFPHKEKPFEFEL